MNPKDLLEQLIDKQDLSKEQVEEFFHSCLTGQLTEAQLAAFLALMRAKGETIDELSTAALVMQKYAHRIDLGKNLIDIVGTGGDGTNTFNVSTACSFVIAACGIPIAKHGNRSVSSKSGSADLLEQAGFILELSDAQMQQCIKEYNLAFLFAPHYHPAMQYARATRKQLGIKTLFNLLGPLINPAGVKRQVVGVFSFDWLDPIARVLANLGSTRCLVVRSEDGLDELSIAAPSRTVEYNKGQYQEWTIYPEEYQLDHKNLDDVIIDTPSQSQEIIESVLSGKKGAARDMVILNAASGIYCAKDHLSFEQAINKAQEAIDNGKALDCYTQLKALTQTLSKENTHE